MKRHAIRLLIAATLAAPLMLLWLNVANQPSDGPTILSKSVLPFYLFGVLFTGNAHAPSTIAVYLSMYSFVFVVVYAISALWTKRHSRGVNDDA
jgi:hypothetical protein